MRRISERARLIGVVAALLGLAIARSVMATARSGQHPRSVLIYYANETVPDGPNRENFNTIIGWLRAGGGPKAQDIAAQLEGDVTHFYAIVDLDIAAISGATAALTPTADVAGIIIFTNRATLGGYALVQRAGDSQPVHVPFKPGREADGPLAWAPLATAKAMGAALDLATQHFSPAEHSFALITTSHGNGDLLITPRLRLWAPHTTQAEVIQFADHPGTGRHIERPGITKSSYVEVLRRADAAGMRFSVVYADSCRGGLSPAQQARIPHDVAAFVVNEGHVGLGDLPLSAMIRESAAQPLADALIAALMQRKATVYERR